MVVGYGLSFGEALGQTLQVGIQWKHLVSVFAEALSKKEKKTF